MPGLAFGAKRAGLGFIERRKPTRCEHANEGGSDRDPRRRGADAGRSPGHRASRIRRRVVPPARAVTATAPPSVRSVRLTGTAGDPHWVRRYAAALVAIDALSFAVAGAVAERVRFGSDDMMLRGEPLGLPYALVTLLLVPAWVSVLALSSAYDRRVVGVGSDEYRRVFDGGVRALALVAFVAFVLDLPLARGFVAIAVPLGGFLTLLGRYLARRWLHRQRSRGHCSRTMIVVGSEDNATQLIRHLQRVPYAGFVVIGACVPGGSGVLEVDGTLVDVLGRPDQARDRVRDLRVDAVGVADSGSLNGSLHRLAWSLEGSGVDLVVAPVLADVAGPRIVARPVAGLPLLHVEEPRLSGFKCLMKVAIDRVVALVGLVMLAPFLLAVGLAVRLTSDGPALFSQLRVGRGGRTFTMRKFRTMHHGAESQVSALAERNEHDGLLFKLRDDPRRTRVGRWLRRYSLDELPQLWNVLRGDMSLVGPRPPLPGEVERYEDHVRRRLLVKPGLTGLWQVSGRSDLPWAEAVRLDLYYIQNWSPALDATILWKTVRVVLQARGAY